MDALISDAHMAPPLFAAGELVEWVVAADDGVSTRRGRIMAVVPAWEDPIAAALNLGFSPPPAMNVRETISYLVGEPAAEPCRLLWPSAWLLKRARWPERAG